MDFPQFLSPWQAVFQNSPKTFRTKLQAHRFRQLSSMLTLAWVAEESGESPISGRVTGDGAVGFGQVECAACGTFQWALG